MKKWTLVKEGVPADQIDAKLATLKDGETKGLSADERRKKFVSKRVAKKAAAKAAGAAESA
jgi:hypothetical protein